MMGLLLARLAIPQPNAGAVAILVNEDHAGSFEGGADGCHCAGHQRIAALKAGNGIGGHTGGFRKIAHAPPQRHTRHLRLNRDHRNPDLKTLFRYEARVNHNGVRNAEQRQDGQGSGGNRIPRPHHNPASTERDHG